TSADARSSPPAKRGVVTKALNGRSCIMGCFLLPRGGMGQYAARESPGAASRDLPTMTTPSRRDLANAIRFLAIDAVQAANSGHPGMPMGMADIAEVLWNDYLGHNPNNPKWFNRDRFVLSNGHGSMLQYALLHLSGYDLPIDQIKRF